MADEVNRLIEAGVTIGTAYTQAATNLGVPREAVVQAYLRAHGLAS